jgi:hypothetical protein
MNFGEVNQALQSGVPDAAGPAGARARGGARCLRLRSAPADLNAQAIERMKAEGTQMVIPERTRKEIP